ncbi:MAG: hypothetical protein H6828_15220 [Planctomycetes bacterium]|nr:hypothetical protein [Planctomycetota bacterium]
MSLLREPTSWAAAPQAPAGPRATARFRWIDRETTEELFVEVTGCEVFFEELAHLGFERVALEDATTPRRSADDGAEHGRARQRARVEATPVRQEQRARRGA